MRKPKEPKIFAGYIHDIRGPFGKRRFGLLRGAGLRDLRQRSGGGQESWQQTVCPASPGAEAMTEPVFGNGGYASTALAERLWWTLNCDGDARDRAIRDAAREIDALTEQRVAAAVQAERERIFPKPVPRRPFVVDPDDRPAPEADPCEARVAAALQEEQLRVEQERRRWLGDPRKSLHIPPADWGPSQNSDRPAPEGAAPTMPLSEACLRGGCQLGPTAGHSEKDLARPPSQDTGKPGCGEIGTLTRHVSGHDDGDTVGYEFNLGNGRQVWCGELSKASFSELDPDQQEALGTDFGWFIVLYERDGGHVLGKAVDEWAAERLVSIIGSALSPPTDAESSPTQAVAAPGPTAGDVESWQDLLDKDDRTSPEEYPEMALITRDEFIAERAAARAELLAQIREPSVFEQIARAMLADIGCGDDLNMFDPNRRVVTAPLSSADFIGMAEAAMDAVADRLTEAK